MNNSTNITQIAVSGTAAYSASKGGVDALTRVVAMPPRKLPPVEAPTLGIWSSNDYYLDGGRMRMSNRFVKGPWRFETDRTRATGFHWTRPTG